MLAILKKGKGVLGSFRTDTVLKLTRSYHDNIIDHYENPRNVGSLDKNKKLVGTGKDIELRRISVSSLSLFLRVS